MDYFNYGMMQHGPATQSLSLVEMDQYIKKTYDNKILYKSDQLTNNMVDLSAIVNNINYLQGKIEKQSTHPQLQTTMEMMATVINKLADENHDLKERLDKLEMLLGEN